MAVPLNVANASAASTAAGAPTPLSMGAQKNPAIGSNQPVQNQPPGAVPPNPVAAARPVVAPHAGAQSVGTHPSVSPLKRGNPTHPFGS